jgi:hypothetical protein
MSLSLALDRPTIWSTCITPLDTLSMTVNCGLLLHRHRTMNAFLVLTALAYDDAAPTQLRTACPHLDSWCVSIGCIKVHVLSSSNTLTGAGNKSCGRVLVRILYCPSFHLDVIMEFFYAPTLRWINSLTCCKYLIKHRYCVK